MLPITTIQAFDHISSKIALSRTLSKSGILTPPFLITDCISKAKEAADILGYPILVKENYSSGGDGIFECNNHSDLELIRPDFFNEPFLVQKKIIGTEIHSSAIYRDERLISFSYCEIKKVINNKFGPSVVRIYKDIACLDETIFLEMEKLGKALNANGFVNVSYIQQTIDEKRYFIEADMRPDAWVEYSKFLYCDPAIKIANWFSKKETLLHQVRTKNISPKRILLPYFHRMTAIEILFNRYKVWKYMPYQDSRMLFFILGEKFLINKIYRKIKRLPTTLDEKFLINKIYRVIKRLPTTLIRVIVPKKEDRARIRRKLS